MQGVVKMKKPVKIGKRINTKDIDEIHSLLK